MKKILIISLNCLSKTNPNGRSLGLLLASYDPKNIANLFVSGSDPDYSVANFFYRVSDGDILHHRKGQTVTPLDFSCAVHSVSHSSHKSAFKMLARDFLWRCSFPRSSVLKWIRSFSPDWVLVQAGDFPFLFDLCRKISTQLDIPLAVYQTEDYFFKRYDFYARKMHASFFSSLLHHRFIHSYRKLMKRTSRVFYNHQALADQYGSCFSKPSTVLYTGSSLSGSPFPEETNPKPRVGYYGNLSLGRVVPLSIIGQALALVDSKCSFYLYGPKAADTAVPSPLTYGGCLNEWGAGHSKGRAEDKLHPWGGARCHLHRSRQRQQTGNQQAFSDRGGQKQHCRQGGAV
jgi:hypothetical protein